MNLISAEKISKSYGIKSLFSNISFGIQQYDKVGIVAKNGSGKSTLLKIIGKAEEPDAGNISFRNDTKIYLLSQEYNYSNDTICENLLRQIDSVEAHAYFSYQDALNADSDSKISEALEMMDNTNAWNFASEIEAMLSLLKVDFREKKWGELSGGQQKRISLAICLLNNPDVLLLDEPTNHIDLDMIEWLENYLINKNCTLIMVTHDRYFLETVCDQIWELDGTDLHQYPGNYSYYMEKKAEREQIRIVNIDKAKNLYKKELEWMRKMPRARGTKAKARVDSFSVIKEKASDKIEKSHLDLNIKTERIGSKILEYHKISKNFDNKTILSDFSYNFKRLEKTGIVGPNGVGKTTLLKLSVGEMQPDKGKIVIGDTIKIGYYKQHGLSIPEDLKVIDYIKNIAEIIPLEKGKKITASQMLERFMFTPEKQYQYISTLSGGERKRLYLLGVLMDNPNFLILDEPTNDLDIYTMNVLEDFLETFPGNVLVVSHDRYFMDKIVDHLFIMRGDGNLKEIQGNYTDYRVWEKEMQKSEKTSQNSHSNTLSDNKSDKNKSKLSYKEKQEFESLEIEIAKLESEKSILNEKLSKGIDDYEELMKLSSKITEISKDLDAKTERWLYLAEFN